MDSFTIRLPEDKNGVERQRTVFKNQFYSFRKQHSTSITAYVIYFTDLNSEIEYHLFKTEDDEWSIDPQGKIFLKDEVLLSIQRAIREKENIASGL